MSSNDILYELLNVPIMEYVRRPPVTVSSSESVAGLMYTMVSKDIGAVIVEEKGQAVGIITEKDVLERAVSKERNLYKTRAKDIMSSPIHSIEADRTIRQALELMQKHKIRRLAVTKNSALVGMVTERRLLAGIISHHI